MDKINEINVEKVVEYVKTLQNEDGSFSGDIEGNFYIFKMKLIKLSFNILFRVNFLY